MKATASRHRYLWPPLTLVPLLLFLAVATPALAQNCSKDNPCATGCCAKSGWCGTTEEHCGVDNCVDTCDFKLQCDKDNPCKIGCCSSAGYCGVGPDYCAEDVCVASCDYKAECDPGFGSEWAESDTCPLNVCCSDFGFCGTTKDFCGDKKVKKPSCKLDGATLDRVVGYYESWGSRRSCNAFWPEQIPLGVYSHINFAFAAIDPDTFEVRPSHPDDLDLLLRVTELKKLDPDLKVLIALGGWTFNDPGPTQSTFSDLARSTENQQKFFKSLLAFLANHNLDGVDLDWEYPVADDRSGHPEDFKNFPTFMSNLKSALESSGGRKELSITLPASYWYLQHFDIKKLARHVDFFNIMSYDLHGKWDRGNEWTGAYLNPHTNLTEIDTALELLWRNDIDYSKVVLGLAFYARAYTLSDPSCVEPGCIFASGARPGYCSREVGILLNSEIDEIMDEKQLSPTFYEAAAAQVLHWDDQWLSYDDEDTLQLKVDYARGACLGGVMVWAISHDTPKAKYSSALGKISHRSITTHPGLFLEGADGDDDLYTTKVDYHLQCKWSNCGDFCPAGWRMITRDDKFQREDGEIMLDTTACTKPHGRRFCCPPSEKYPSCGWYSLQGGKCDSACPSGYREIGSLKSGCRGGYQAACCTLKDDDGKLLDSMRLYEACDWAEAPMCMDGKCTFAGSPWPTMLTNSTSGSGAAVCNAKTAGYTTHGFEVTVQSRKYCCDQSSDNKAKWVKCEWRGDFGSDYGSEGRTCKSNCASNEVKVAMETGEECRYGEGGGRSFCCQGTYNTEQQVLIDELAQWESVMAAWANNPTCDADNGILGARSTDEADQPAVGELDKRGQFVLAERPVQEASAMLAELITGYEQENITKVFRTKESIFNKHMKPLFDGLTTDPLLPWITSDSLNPTHQLYSNQKQAKEVLCQAYMFQAMALNDTDTLPLCPHTPLSDGDLDDVDESSIAVDELYKRWLDQRRALHLLEKRSLPKPRRVVCRDGKREVTIQYQSQAYPSAGEWGEEEPIRNAYDLADYVHCHTPEIRTYDIRGAHGDFDTEHLIELNSMRLFIEWAAEADNDECKNIDCDFFQLFFNKQVLQNAPALPGLADSHQANPLQRVMEQLGSYDERENFVVLFSAINGIKNQLWEAGQPRSETTWLKQYLGDLPAALGLIRDTIAVFNYLRTPAVWDRFKSINAKIRVELQRAQDQYKADHGTDIDLLDCWDAWMKMKLESLVEEGLGWVQYAMTDMIAYYTPAQSPTEDPLGHEQFQVMECMLDLLSDRAASAMQHSNFDLDLKGDPMDLD